MESLNDSPEVPKLRIMRRGTYAGLFLGLVGLTLTIVGAVLDLSVLNVIASVSIVAACAISVISGLASMRTSETSGDLESRIQSVTTPHIDMDAPVPLTGPTTESSVVDKVTELPDGRFFEVAVDGRVAAARRHLWPVSLVLIEVGFDPETSSQAVRDQSLASFANVMRQTLREADIACRLSENVFGLILEDTSEEGGVWTAERLQIALAHNTTDIRRLVAGVAAYPTHGLFAKDVLVRAEAALQRAASTPPGHGLGQVEVAHVDLG